MTVEYSVANASLRSLIEEFSPLGELSNEAQTRFSFIDRVLRECLGWDQDVKVEVYENGERSDYECGTPRQLIVEAKRPANAFSFPPKGKTGIGRQKLRSILDFDGITKDGVEQVLNYCQARGVQFAALTNGPQWILFLATRLDGTSPLEGDALVFDGYESLVHGFSNFYEYLSPEGIEEKRLSALLAGTARTELPAKLSSACLNYFAYKYSSEFQENIRNASSLIIEDIGKADELEQEFLRECYCESGPLTQYASLGKNILSTRYAALFSSSESASRVEEINPKREKAALSDKVVAEALARRPIVFLGDVGVGKTSFIRNLIKVDASSEFKNALFIYFDLGSRGALTATTRDALLNQIEHTLRKEYGINLMDRELLETIYRSELSDFDSGFIGALRDSQPAVFDQKRIEHIQSLIKNRAEHLRKCVEEVARVRRCQIVIVIDNADQRHLSVQQEAFVIAHELANSWNALVFLSLRPQTFHASKRSGTISAYPPKVFVISPPKLEDVIQKRLAFALKVAEGRLPVSKIKDLSMHVESLAILIRVLQASLRDNREIYEFIVNVSSGNVRIAIELISKFLGNPNIESDRIVKIASETGSYVIPLHEFAKGGLLGDYAYYQEDASYAFNVFSVVFPEKKEHFLSLLILGYLSWDGAHREQVDGFVGRDGLLRELQRNGFTHEQTISHLQRLVRKKLIETTERRTLETDKEIEELGIPEAFRLTLLGAYHLKKWGYEFSFIEAMAFDTPIFDKVTQQGLMAHINDQTLTARYERATAFKAYLDGIWKGLQPQPYFDWEKQSIVGRESFNRVEKRLRDLGYL